MAFLGKTTRYKFHFKAFPDTFRKARELRREMTQAESELWKEIRSRKLEGIKFRRQHPIGQFIVDFYCSEKNLVIEIDGDIHEDELIKEYDQNRSFELEKLGLKVIRFNNSEVLGNLNEVLQEIRQYLE
jgi:very-short-patch-repair endonuclease